VQLDTLVVECRIRN